MAITVPDRRVAVGESTTVRIEASGLTEGLAGFSMRLSMDDGRVATFTDATIEPDFGVVDVSVSGRSVEVSALNRDGTVEPTDDCGEAKGLTDFALTIDSMNDDEGRPISPEVEVGRITVVE